MSRETCLDPLSTTVMCAEELYSCRDHGRPILHSTSIELRLRHEQAGFLLADHESGLFFPNDIFLDLHPTTSRDSLQIDGGIVTPLKISVSRQQYRQVVKTLSNLSVATMEDTTNRQGLSSVVEEGTTVIKTETSQRPKSSQVPVEADNTLIAVKGSFSVPNLCVELRGDVGEKEKPLVNLLLEELKATYESCEPYKTKTQLTLRSLMMEDLQQSDTSTQHRFLMNSDTVPQDTASDTQSQFQHSSLYPSYHSHSHFLHEHHVPEFISTSCPEFWQHHAAHLASSSLPSELKMEKPFFKALQKPTITPKKNLRGLSSQSPHISTKCNATCTKSPCTPPPSPTPGEEPHFAHRPHTTLVTITISDIDKRCPEYHSKYDGTNRFVDVDFNSLTTVVNISSWVMVLDFFSTDQDDSVLNMTSREVTPDTSKEFGPRVTEELNTIVEVQVRSLTLIFNKTDCELARASISQVLVRSVGSEGNLTLTGRLGSLSLVDCTSHGHLYREKFITAGNEAMTFQVFRSHDSRSRSHSRHRDGNQSYTSESDAEGDLRQQQSHSVSQKCLLDVLYIDLVNMDIYTSTRSPPKKSYNSGRNNQGISKSKSSNDTGEIVEWIFGSFSVMRQGTSMLYDKCALKLQVERNLDTAVCHEVPDMSIHGTVNKVHVTIDTADYKLIRGLLMFNLGEPLPSVPMPAYLYQSQPQQWWHSATSVRTSLNIILNLDNVTLELENLEQDNVQGSKSCTPLACINFISSRLTYENFSDYSKDVDLVSQEILISDTRFEGFPVNKRSNIFTNILQPTPSKSAKNNSQLQAEVHYRSTKNVTRFTILLNNMRLMGILDWWWEVLDFIYMTPDNPFHKGEKNGDNSKETSGSPSTVVTPVLFSPILTPMHSTPLHPSPQTQSPQPQSPRSESPAPKERTIRSNTPKLNPMVESTGVMTKHAIFQEQNKVPFELKLNITDSELVVVENTAVWDTSAVILRSTAVVSYRPQHQERPLSCNLNQCELYSCILGLEDDTALSIIDPVTINIEVIMHQLNIRLSYHDMKMFQQILESVPKQREVAKKPIMSKEMTQPANFQAQVDKLSALGFCQMDCKHALEKCEGRLDDAALWLTHNAQPVPAATVTPADINKKGAINLHALEIKTGSVNICVIDDCGDCDVPLLEFSLSHLGLKQDWYGKGSASCSLSANYYNRALSGWEPFLEPWLCQADWDKSLSRDLNGERLTLTVMTKDTVNVNITQTLLELYRMVKNNWTSDYYNRERLEVETSTVSSEDGCKGIVVSPQGYRRRSPFIPFALKNDTGCDLTFATMTATPDRQVISSVLWICVIIMADMEILTRSDMPKMDWIHVPAGSTVPFSFEGRGKQRHRDTHELKVHQLLVQVDGWQPIGPVTVDKVGIFFRLASSLPSTSSTLNCELPSARIIMAVTLDGSARKLVTIRSALLLTNLLNCPVDIRLENSAVRLGGKALLMCMYIMKYS
ncbi:Vacuolar protein sorting-associated protein 13D-like 2, partial [Homarus americanus]